MWIEIIVVVALLPFLYIVIRGAKACAKLYSPPVEMISHDCIRSVFNTIRKSGNTSLVYNHTIDYQIPK